jgi:hypothetical protein
VSFYFDGTHWRTPGSILPQDDTPLAPGQAVFLVTRGSQALSITTYGVLDPSSDRPPSAPAGDSLVSLRLPLATTLDALHLERNTAWKTGAAASLSDTARLWNGTSWNIFYHNGSYWESVGSFENQNTASIPAHSALFLRKAPASPAK